jgi:diacylglycerol kinase family enzyme
VLAAGWILWALRPFNVELTVEGVARRYESTLLFVSVGERDLKPEDYGYWPTGGRRGLHVMVARGGGRWRLMRFARAVARRSRVRGARTPTFDSFLVDHCQVTFPRRHGNVAIDGEIVPMASPLAYRIARDTLKVVVPAGGV